MDLSKYDTRLHSETPRPLQLRNPSNADQLLWLEEPKGVEGDKDYNPGRPMLVFVRGSESQYVQDETKAIRLGRMDKGNRKERRAAAATGIPTKDDRSVLEYHSDKAELAVPLIAGFENVTYEGRELTVDDALMFLNMQVMNMGANREQRSFLEQVLEFSSDRGEWVGNE